MKRFVATSAGVILLFSALNAQKGIEDGSRYGHGKDSITCLTNLSLYTEYYKQKNYMDAFPYWESVFNDCPLASSTIYVNGIVILRNFIEQETNLIKKEEYYNYLLKVYDARIKYFGNNNKYPTSYINGLKAIDMLRYKRDSIPVCKQAYNLLTQSISEFGARTQPTILSTHMSNTLVLLQNDQITASEFIDVYLSVSEILNIKQANITEEADDLTAINDTRNIIEKQFATSGVANCENLDKIFSPQYSAHNKDVNWLKRVNTLLLNANCDNALLYQISESLHQIEPSAPSAKGMAVMCLKKKETDKAIEYYKEAINLEQQPDKKAVLYYELGVIYSTKNNYNIARQHFQRAIELKPNWGAPYIQIGRLYANTADICGKDEFEKKVVYWAAVDKFIKARSVDTTLVDEANKQISSIAPHFPSKEEIFFQGLQEGASYNIGCWINETTTIRAKK
jgi:tetratricopeptide (TPR) repeat protein